MGAQLSSCCGASEKSDDKLGITAPEPHKQVIGQAEIAAYKKRLEQGVIICITLGDSSRLNCDLHYASEVGSLFISCVMNGERRVRPIHMKTISAILHTPTEIQTLELAAGVKDDDHCVALCMESAGGCLPLFFPSAAEKALFVAFVLDTTKFKTQPAYR